MGSPTIPRKRIALERDSIVPDNLEKFCEYTSAHGFVWYLRTDSTLLKAAIFVSMFAVGVSMFVYVSWDFVAFLDSSGMTDATTWRTATSIMYPNVSICNAKYFSNERLRENGISNEMANYLTMVFDPMAPSIRAAKTEQNSSYADRLADLSTELDRLLSSKNVTFLELMNAVAVRCNDTLPLCDIHSKQYSPCCGPDLFDPVPFYSVAGTCFRWRPLAEDMALSIRSVRFTMFMNDTDSPVFLEDMRGAIAADLKGFVFTIGSEDHPAALLNSDPYAAPLGEIKVVKLSLHVFGFGQIRAREKYCKDIQQEQYREMHDMRYTKLNCMLVKAYQSPNCSFLASSNIIDRSNLPQCLPRDRLEMASAEPENDTTMPSGTYFDEKERPWLKEDYKGLNYCTLGCNDIVYKYDTVMQTKKLDFSHSNHSGKFGDSSGKDAASVVLFFGSFEVGHHSFSHKTITGFLADVGGYLGLFIGASVISIIETAVFSLVFCGKFWHKLLVERKIPV